VSFSEWSLKAGVTASWKMELMLQYPYLFSYLGSLDLWRVKKDRL